MFISTISVGSYIFSANYSLRGYYHRFSTLYIGVLLGLFLVLDYIIYPTSINVNRFLKLFCHLSIICNMLQKREVVIVQDHHFELFTFRVRSEQQTGRTV
jgi:hypothetical protein